MNLRTLAARIICITCIFHSFLLQINSIVHLRLYFISSIPDFQTSFLLVIVYRLCIICTRFVDVISCNASPGRLWRTVARVSELLTAGGFFGAAADNRCWQPQEMDAFRPAWRFLSPRLRKIYSLERRGTCYASCRRFPGL